MSDFCRTAEQRKAAKDHRCTYCGEAIPKGEVYQEQTGVWDGAAFRNKFHAECFQALCDEGEGEFTPYSESRPERRVRPGSGAFEPVAYLYHDASANCWCEPTIDYKDPDTGVAVYVHRSMQ